MSVDTSDVVKVEDRRTRKPETKLAQKFADLVRDGKSPKTAASLLKINLADPQMYDVRAEVESLLRGYAMKPEIAKEFVRASRNKILLESMGINGGEKNYDLALNAAKQIASDPDVGLNAPPAPLVQLTFNSIEELLTNLDEKGVILDAAPEPAPEEAAHEEVAGEGE